MSTNTNTNNRRACTVCNATLATRVSLQRHMQRFHPAQYQELGRALTYHPCSEPNCNRLNTNTRPDSVVDHLSINHGIDPPAMERTTARSYLRRKNIEVLQNHTIQEARELNELNAKIHLVECLVAEGHYKYQSCHSFDLDTKFEVKRALLPGNKEVLIAYLKRIRETRNELGSLYIRRGEMDTRDGIVDELESLL